MMEAMQILPWWLPPLLLTKNPPSKIICRTFRQAAAFKVIVLVVILPRSRSHYPLNLLLSAHDAQRPPDKCKVLPLSRRPARV